MAKNSELQQIAARLSERAAVLHTAALFHLEAGRVGIMTGSKQSHLQSAIALKLSEESRKIDAQLLRLIKENPTLEITPANEYTEISNISNLILEETANAKMDTRGTGTAAGIVPTPETLAIFNGG